MQYLPHYHLKGETMNKNIFTVIIPIFQTPTIFELFIRSLKESIMYNTKIIFINDGSSVETIDKINILEDIKEVEINCLNHYHPKGCVKCINEALPLIEGDYTIMMDSDIILPLDWQNDLINSFHDLNNVGAIGSLLLYPQSDGIQNCGLIFAERLIKHQYFNNRTEFLSLPKYLKVQSTVFAFCAIPNEVINSVGLLDDSFFNGNEDVDYQLRIQKQGYDIFINTSICIYHWEKSNGVHRIYNQRNNLTTLWKKHGSFIKNDLWYVLKQQLEKKLTDDNYILLDLSESRIDSNQFRKNIEIWYSLTDWLDYSYLCTANENIKFAEIFPIDMVRSSIPYIILCDNFTQLLENRYWLNIRKEFSEKDIVVDFFGNVILLQSLTAYTWPGQRKR